MSIRVGDALFIRNGHPATVRDREELSGKLELETDREKIREHMRHGYLNGISPEHRTALYEILDQVKAESVDPEVRVERLRQKVQELEQDPRNTHLTRYLRAEMTHIMNTFQIRPREYVMYENKVR